MKGINLENETKELIESISTIRQDDPKKRRIKDHTEQNEPKRTGP